QLNFISAKQSLHFGKTEPSFRQNRAFIAAKQSLHCGETELLFFPKAIHSGEEVRNNSRFQPILGVFP
ncbi:hypothetical protein, partial [Bacteroides pyogenes]|uniref:hypothetical protein n=1 Tax=Bacteroides pyogenes TaxID=310300 RepID=UPI001BA8891A